MPLKFDDGGHDTAFLVGSPRTEVDKTTRLHSTFYRYRQTASGYQASRLNNGGPKYSDTDGNGGYYVGQSQPRELDCGIFEWEHEFAQVPPTQVTPVSYSYPYQFIVSSDIVSITMTVAAIIIYDYFYIATISNPLAGGSAADTISNFLSGDPTLGGSPAAAAIAFFLTGQSQAVPGLALAYKLQKSGDTIVQTGTPPPAGATYALGEDQTQIQLAGNIYQRRTLLVPVKLVSPH